MTYLQKKKLAFMSIVNRIKGFVRTVSGVPPVTLPDCADRDSLINYIISGNSVQNGTPTPETPVEFESVGEYDEETGMYKIPVVCSDEKGNSVATIIYLDEPLRKVDNYADYIDFENQKIIKHIYREKITSVTSMSSISGTYRIFLSDISKKAADVRTGSYVWGAMSDKFKNAGYRLYAELVSSGGVIGRYMTSNRIHRVAYTFTDSAINTVASAQTAIGDGFDVYYPLAEPEEIPISLPKLPTVKGSTMYSTDTTVQPSNMTATYYATSKE